MGASTVIIQETPPPNPGAHARARPGAFRKEDGPPASWRGGRGGVPQQVQDSIGLASSAPPWTRWGEGLAGPGNIH